MNPSDTAPPRIDEEHIERLISTAQEVGTADVYAGKRRWARYNAGIGLDVSVDPTDPSRTQAAVMHNASGGGVAFWSRREMCEHDAVFIREPSTTDSAGWIPARVCHCTRGLRGFLIGVHFDEPVHPAGDDGGVSNELSQDDDDAGTTTQAAAEPDAQPRGLRRWFRRR